MCDAEWQIIQSFYSRLKPMAIWYLLSLQKMLNISTLREWLLLQLGLRFRTRLKLKRDRNIKFGKKNRLNMAKKI
mgnify:FL=1